MLSKNVIIALIAAVVVVAAGAAVFVLKDGDNGNNKDNGTDDNTPTTITITDSVGRTVEVPKDIDNVAITGKGLAIFMSMFDPTLVHYCDKGSFDFNIDRAYTNAFDFTKIQRTEYGGGKNPLSTQDIETIAKGDADVVFVTEWTYTANKDNFDILAQAKPMVVVNNGDDVLWENYKFAAHLEQCVKIIGKVLNKEDRAKEIVDGINGILADQKSKIGTQTHKIYYGGTQGKLNKTYSSGSLFFENIGIHNVYEKPSDVLYGTTELKTEDVTTLGMEIFLLQPGCHANILGKEAQDILKWIYTVNNDGDATNDVKIFAIMPHASAGALIDCILATGFAIEAIEYGTCDVDYAKTQFDKIMQLFFGENGKGMFDKMNALYKTETAKNGCEIAMHQFHQVVKSGDNYVLKPVA